LEQELKRTFGSDITVELIPGSGGVYEIGMDGKTIFSKKQLNRFPEEGEVIRLIRSAG